MEVSNIRTYHVTEHAKIRIKERVPNIGNEKPVSLFKRVMTHGKNLTDFYGEYKNYLTDIYAKNNGKMKLKMHGSNIYLYNSTNSKHILVTVLNTPKEFEPYRDYLCVNRYNKDVIERLRLKRLENKESDVMVMTNEGIVKVPREEMLHNWTEEQLEEWKEKAYADRENTYFQCHCCGRYLPCTEFSISSGNKFGFSIDCKECIKAVREYGGIKKMRNDGITIFDLLGIDDPSTVVENTDTPREPIRISKADVGLRDKILRCRECDDDFLFNWGEQIYYKNHGYFEPSKCPACREKAKLEKAKIEEAQQVEQTATANVTDMTVKPVEGTVSDNDRVVVNQAQELLKALKDHNLSLEAFESILSVYNNTNSYAIELTKTLEGILDSMMQVYKDK